MSNELKHTPGPWECSVIELPTIDDLKEVVVHADGLKIKVGSISFFNRERSEASLANAKLIAAAPELLEALIECLPLVQYLDPATYIKATEAVKKATE